MIKHGMWETGVYILIFLSSLKLAVDTYFWKLDETSDIIQASLQIDFIFNYLFIAEMLFKLMAMGLIMDEGSYLRDSWN
jgi:hypothetical protein